MKSTDLKYLWNNHWCSSQLCCLLLWEYCHCQPRDVTLQKYVCSYYLCQLLLISLYVSVMWDGLHVVMMALFDWHETCAAAAAGEAVSSCLEHSGAESRSTRIVEPPAKKSRLLGDIDINSPDVQKLIQAKSAHTSLVDEVFSYLWIAVLWFCDDKFCWCTDVTSQWDWFAGSLLHFSRSLSLRRFEDCAE